MSSSEDVQESALEGSRDIPANDSRAPSKMPGDLDRLRSQLRTPRLNDDTGAGFDSTENLDPSAPDQLRRPRYRFPLTPGESPVSRATQTADQVSRTVQSTSDQPAPPTKQNAFLEPLTPRKSRFPTLRRIKDFKVKSSAKTLSAKIARGFNAPLPGDEQSAITKPQAQLESKYEEPSKIQLQTELPESSPVQLASAKQEPKWLIWARNNDFTLKDFPKTGDEIVLKLETEANYTRPVNAGFRVKSELERLSGLLQSDQAEEHDVAHYILFSYAVFGFSPLDFAPTKPDDFHVLEPPTCRLAFMYFAMDKIQDTELLAVAMWTFGKVLNLKTTPGKFYVNATGAAVHYGTPVQPQGVATPGYAENVASLAALAGLEISAGAFIRNDIDRNFVLHNFKL